jgi:hypothetical protein
MCLQSTDGPALTETYKFVQLDELVNCKNNDMIGRLHTNVSFRCAKTLIQMCLLL